MVNGYFIFVLLTLLGFFLLDVAGKLLNVAALRPELPSQFADVYDAEKYAQSQTYTRAGTRFDLVESSFGLIVFLTFWWLGGFGWLDELVRGFSESMIIRGLWYCGLLYLGSTLVDLPFEIYNTFALEERFGFNKTTPKTFALDRLKGLALAIVLGAPVLAVILWLFHRFDASAWLYGWGFVSLFSIVMMYLAPQIILPLFHKFQPLEEGELKSAIQEMSGTCDFPLREVFEIDGSRRSTKSNAFFTGFGKNKKIALYDTLIKNHTVGELVAVLAHEIGHYKKKHIVQSLVLGIVQTGILFFLLGFFLKNEGLFKAFGVRDVSIYGSLVLFFFLYEPINKLLSVGLMMLSRKNEYEADAYAAEVTGRPGDLITGLKKLSEDNLVNLTPHPFYVFMNYSHPPMLKRIGALEARVLKSH